MGNLIELRQDLIVMDKSELRAEMPYVVKDSYYGRELFLDKEEYDLCNLLISSGPIDRSYLHNSEWTLRSLAGLQKKALVSKKGSNYTIANAVRVVARRFEGATCQPTGFPRSIYLFITDRCNLKCKHCFRNAGSAEHTSSLQPELSTVQIKNILNQCESNGAFSVAINGGEPMIRRDFGDILEYATNLRFDTILFTNGSCIDQSNIHHFVLAHKKKGRGFHVQISLDGGQARTHEWLRGRSGIFHRTVEIMRLLAEQSIRFAVEMSLHPGNIREIGKVVEICLDCGARSLLVHPIVIVGRARDSQQNLYLGFQGMKKTYQKVMVLKEQYRDQLLIEFKTDTFPLESFQDPTSRKKARLEKVFYNRTKELPRRIGQNFCIAGMSHMVIAPDGKVYPCSKGIAPKFEMGCALKENLMSIWRSPHWNALFRGGWHPEMLNVCPQCPHFDICLAKRCRVVPALTLGDLWGPSEDCVRDFAAVGLDSRLIEPYHSSSGGDYHVLDDSQKDVA